MVVCFFWVRYCFEDVVIFVCYCCYVEEWVVWVCFFCDVVFFVVVLEGDFDFWGVVSVVVVFGVGYWYFDDFFGFVELGKWGFGIGDFEVYLFVDEFWNFVWF